MSFGSADVDFDAYDEFVPDHLPTPGAFLDGHAVLAGEEHLAVHHIARDLFEERGVYDMTFGYNLARLNCDPRHPDAGFRYAEEDNETLRALFTPTTPFCPQSHTLAKGAFRAWNGLRDRHGYDLVRIRVDPMHHESGETNANLEALEATFVEHGELPEPSADDALEIPNVSDSDSSDMPF